MCIRDSSVSDAKLDAVELLLHSFGSAATFLNPQATRCACLYTLDFDPSGTVISAAVRVSNLPLKKLFIAYRHYNCPKYFNIDLSSQAHDCGSQCFE